VLIAVFVPVSLHSQVMSVSVFNGLNFFYWSEQVQFHLGVLDFFMLRSMLLLLMLAALKRKLIIKSGKGQTDLV